MTLFKNAFKIVIGLLALVAPASLAHAFAPGDFVKIEYNNAWYPATVLQVKPAWGTNAYQIKYSGSGISEWVAPNRIFPSSATSGSPVGALTDAATLSVGRYASVEYNGQWYPAQVLGTKRAFGVDSYHIKYTQSGLQEWVAPNRIKSQ